MTPAWSSLRKKGGGGFEEARGASHTGEHRKSEKANQSNRSSNRSALAGKLVNWLNYDRKNESAEAALLAASVGAIKPVAGR
jgi:hypothetical protein